jgi:AAA domain
MTKRDAADFNRDEGSDAFREHLDQEIGNQRGKKKGNGKSKPSRFRLKPFADVKSSDEPCYLVKGILPRSGLAVIWGAPKCGKSFWTFDLVMHVAIGRAYRGRRIQQGAVVYLALEGGSGFANRIEAWRQRCLGEHNGAVPFFLVDVALNLVAEHADLITAIREQLGDTHPAIVVVDTLNRSLAGSENKDEDMGAYIRAADAIRLTFGCLVLIIHHSGIAKNRPRGHTSLAGADDAQIAVERDKNGNVIARVEHMKDAEAGAVITSKLELVELGTDRDGDTISSCIIVPSDVGEKGHKLSKAQLQGDPGAITAGR